MEGSTTGGDEDWQLKQRASKRSGLACGLTALPRCSNCAHRLAVHAYGRRGLERGQKGASSAECKRVLGEARKSWKAGTRYGTWAVTGLVDV